MLKKYISVFLVVISVLLVMTACGKNENTDTTTQSEVEDNQIILDEDTTEDASKNAFDEDANPTDSKNESENTTKPSKKPSTTKPTQENSSTTKPNTTNPTTTKPSTTKPTTTNKNDSGVCSKCGGIITNDDGKLSVGKYCDGKCDEWYGV